MVKENDENKSRLQRADEKRKRKAEKAVREGRPIEIIPSGSKTFPQFARVSNHRKALWSRQYVRHKKTGVITQVIKEIK